MTGSNFIDIILLTIFSDIEVIGQEEDSCFHCQESEIKTEGHYAMQIFWLLLKERFFYSVSVSTGFISIHTCLKLTFTNIYLFCQIFTISMTVELCNTMKHNHFYIDR